MAHEIAIINGKASVAYVGEKPWHGLGQKLTENASLEVWKTEAGMDWEIKSSPAYYNDGNGMKPFPGKRILYRSDTLDELAIVSDDYKVVQPGEVLDFFRDLVSEQGMTIETAGVLYGGRRFWALANTGQAFDVLGKDRVRGMLLLTTSCDGTLATNAFFTSVRVVCNNTLKISMNNDSKSAVKVTHHKVFDANKVKVDLGLFNSAWSKFKDNIIAMSKVKMTEKATAEFVRGLFANPEKEEEKQPYTVEKYVNDIIKRAKNGMGSNMTSGTLWGVLNGVTEFVDHGNRSRIPDHALWNSWFGKGADLKTRAYKTALELI